MEIYRLFIYLTWLVQTDAVDSVQRIGFWATIGLIFTALIVWAVRQLFSYFTTRLDKKDELISKHMEERHNDLLRLEGVLTAHTQIQRDQVQTQRDSSAEEMRILRSLADSVQSLANDLRNRK